MSGIEEYDLVIVGTGSGNSLIVPEMDSWRIAIVERGVFGGTCLNRGCIPSKMLVHSADLAHQATDGERFGVHSHYDGADWPGIVARVFGRIDPIAEGGRSYRLGLPHVDVFEGEARFTGERELEVLGTRIRGRNVVLAAGARSFVPDIAGIDEVPYHTSDDVMRIGRLPRHLVVVGGGFIAAELGHVFRSLGSAVTVVNRGHRLLTAEDDDVSIRFTEEAAHRFDLVLGAKVERAHMTAGGIALRVTGSRPGRAPAQEVVEGDVLLVAAGRRPNGDQLGAEVAGVEIGPDGAVRVDEYGRTSAPGVWALGDVNGRHQLKHMANGEARVIRHNLLNPGELRPLDTRPAPHAVFTLPQIGSVGITGREAKRQGLDVRTVVQPYGAAAYGWALEDNRSFVKLIGDPATRRLLGAHVIGHEASMLTQQIVQGMHLGTTVDEMAHGQIWIHPALNEVVEQALLGLADAFDAG